MGALLHVIQLKNLCFLSPYQMAEWAGDECCSTDCEEDYGPSRNSEELLNPSNDMQYFPVSGVIFCAKLHLLFFLSYLPVLLLHFSCPMKFQFLESS